MHPVKPVKTNLSGPLAWEYRYKHNSIQVRLVMPNLHLTIKHVCLVL